MRKKQTLGEFLRKHRLKNGLTYRSASELTGVPHTIIYQIEKGVQKRPSFRNMVRMAKAYKFSLDKMLKEVACG